MSGYALKGFLIQCACFTFLLAESGNAQKSIEEVYLSIQMENVKVKQIFSHIEKNTPFSFAYPNNVIENNKKINVDFQNESLANLLRYVSKNSELGFKRIGQTIHVNERSDQESDLVETIFVDVDISGKVTDENGEGLPGASVVEKGSTNGVTTNLEGNYKFSVSEDAVLTITFVGYEAQEITIGSQSVIDVQMVLDAKRLEELVVVGYSSKRKEDIISAISVVDVEEMKDVPATSVSRMLLGQAPGVSVASSSGRPGENLDISIRGMGSLGAGNDPLWVVDGFPLESSVGINPSEIQSIAILKDAASTAIYGARGSNGVILVTTKQGSVGKTTVTLDVTTGVQNIPDNRRFDMMNAVEFGEFQKSSWVDRYIAANGSEPAESEIPAGIRNPENNTISTDWMEEILADNPIFSKYDLTIASGSEKTKSLVTLGYMNQEGVVIKTNFERFNIRAKVDSKVADKVTIGMNASANHTNERLIGEGNRHTPVGLSLWVDPREPVYEEDGSFNAYLGDKDTPGDLIFNSANPVQILHEQKTTRVSNRVMANSYAEFKFLEDFTFKTSLNASLENIRNNQFTPSTLSGFSWNRPAPNDARLTESYLETFNWSADQLLSYAKVLNDVHSINALLGYTSQEATVNSIGGNGSKFPDDDIRFLQHAETSNVSSEQSSWSLLAYFAQLNYSYNNRYLVSATYRREGSSRFGSDNRWGNFPAASVGWRISEEAFLQDVSWVNDLKVRASFGATGNNDIGDYISLSTLGTTNYITGGSFAPGKILNSLSNANLGWEKSEQYDYGIDLSMFNNRLTFVAEYYKKTTTDMLLAVSVPVITGFETTFTNIGKVENTGVELGLNFKTNITQDLRFRSNFNISFNKNKVLEIDGDNDEIRSGGIYGSHHLSKVGRPIAMLHGFRNLGVFQSQAEIDASPTQDGAVPGSFKYWDANGDGEISYNFDDYVEIGNPHPEFVYAFNMGLDYKAFDFNVVFTGAENYQVFTTIEHTTMNVDGVFNVERKAKDRFRYTTMSGDAGPTSNFWKWEREGNSYYISDASHVWLRSMSFGYTISANGISFLDGARVYVNADNLHLFSDYPYGNPQPNDRGGLRPGVDETPYPLARTFTVGATFNF